MPLSRSTLEMVWVVNNYGATQAGLNTTVQFNFVDGTVTNTTITDYTLYKRPSNAYQTWTDNIVNANNVSSTAGNNHINFSAVNSFSTLVPIEHTAILNLNITLT